MGKKWVGATPLAAKGYFVFTLRAVEMGRTVAPPSPLSVRERVRGRDHLCSEACVEHVSSRP